MSVNRLRVLQYLLAVVALAVVCVLSPPLIVNSLQSRPSVDGDRLASVDIELVNALPSHGWTPRDVSDERRFAREWEGEDGSLVLLEIWELPSVSKAIWVFYSETVKHRYSRSYPGLVKSVNSSDLAAEQLDVFCGNIGRSDDDSLKDCTIWGYWARYGQYVIYLEVYGMKLARDDFLSLVGKLDEHLEGEFASH